MNKEVEFAKERLYIHMATLVSPESITEGNKRISVFMDMVNGAEDIFNYDKKWGFIMRVIEKIETVSTDLYTGFTVRIEGKHCMIACYGGGQAGCIYQTPYGYEPESKIMATWLGVVDFIHFYTDEQEWRKQRFAV